MNKSTDASIAPDDTTDHRVASARRKREEMRTRILDATMRVFARISDDAPVIEDVVRDAGIARGTFYKHFDSLDRAVVAAGTEANNRMITDILPLYDCLGQPWQRAAVGFSLFLLRAWQDPTWAAFVTRMTQDLQRGKDLGQFAIDDVRVANDFIMGASAGGIQAFRGEMADPVAYIDAARADRPRLPGAASGSQA